MPSTPRSNGRMRSLSICLVTLLLAAPSVQARPDDWHREGREAIERARARQESERARNLILFVGDGMGISTVTAARILAGQLRGEPGEENLLSFEQLPYLALSKTYNTNQQVPDSAGTMTAMVTGVKTRAGVISLDEDARRADWAGAADHEIPTLLEQAEQRGMQTGVVTTTSVTHATPAAAYAHAPERNWEDDSTLPALARQADYPDIARQLIEFPYGDGIDVVLGGGRKRFLPAEAGATNDPRDANPLASVIGGGGSQGGKRLDGRDLTREWAARDGAVYVGSRAEWDAIDWSAAPRVLGLFGPSHLDFAAQRAEQEDAPPDLAEMTAAAIERLSRSEEGFVLVVEAGRIDHAHHGSSAYYALHDTLELSRAVQAALDRVDLADTLVIVTADHDHTFTMAGYPQRGNPILGLVVTPDLQGELSQQTMKDGNGLPFTTLGYANGPGWLGGSKAQPPGPKHYPHLSMTFYDDPPPRHDLAKVDTTAPDYLQESAIPMTAETHAGHDVPIYAGGPSAHLFHGVQEQSYIYHVAVEALGWNEPSGASSWFEWLLGD